ncbi:Uncharacterised protein g5815 [Pycnogonum litorale]
MAPPTIRLSTIQRLTSSFGKSDPVQEQRKDLLNTLRRNSRKRGNQETFDEDLIDDADCSNDVNVKRHRIDDENEPSILNVTSNTIPKRIGLKRSASPDESHPCSLSVKRSKNNSVLSTYSSSRKTSTGKETDAEHHQRSTKRRLRAEELVSPSAKQQPDKVIEANHVMTQTPEINIVDDTSNEDLDKDSGTSATKMKSKSMKRMYALASKTSPDRNKPFYLPTSKDREKDRKNEVLRLNRFLTAFKTNNSPSSLTETNKVTMVDGSNIVSKFKDSSVSPVSDAATNSNVVLPTVSSSSSQFVMSPSTPTSALGSSTNASVLNCKPSNVQVTVSTAVSASNNLTHVTTAGETTFLPFVGNHQKSVLPKTVAASTASKGLHGGIQSGSISSTNKVISSSGSTSLNLGALLQPSKNLASFTLSGATASSAVPVLQFGSHVTQTSTSSAVPNVHSSNGKQPMNTGLNGQSFTIIPSKSAAVPPAFQIGATPSAAQLSQNSLAFQVSNTSSVGGQAIEISSVLTKESKSQFGTLSNAPLSVPKIPAFQFGTKSVENTPTSSAVQFGSSLVSQSGSSSKSDGQFGFNSKFAPTSVQFSANNANNTLLSTSCSGLGFPAPPVPVGSAFQFGTANPAQMSASVTNGSTLSSTQFTSSKFQFGTLPSSKEQTTTPSFQFGTDSSKSTTAPTSVFGASSSMQQTTAFQFGAGSPATSANSAFQFGVASTSTTSPTNSSMFQSGMTATTQSPSNSTFSFADTTSTPSNNSPFQFGQKSSFAASLPPSLPFGNSNPLLSTNSTTEKSSSNSPFQFGQKSSFAASLPPSLPFENSNPLLSTNSTTEKSSSNSPFQFGQKSSFAASSTPSLPFGNSNPLLSTNSTTENSSTPAFQFGSPAATSSFQFGASNLAPSAVPFHFGSAPSSSCSSSVPAVNRFQLGSGPASSVLPPVNPISSPAVFNPAGDNMFSAGSANAIPRSRRTMTARRRR